MLKLIVESSRFRIVFAVLKALLDSLSPILPVIIVKVVMDLVTTNRGLLDLIVFLLIALVIYLIIGIYDGWYNQKYCIHSDLKIQKNIQTKLYSNIQNIDMEAFDDANFYSSYTKAVKETSSRAVAVLDTLANLLRSVLSFIGVISIIIWLNPIIILFVLVSVVISIIVSNIQNKVSYQCDMEQINDNRKADYTKRIFYLQQYAKEIKICRMYDYFIKKFGDAIHGLHEVRKKYDNKLFVFDFLQNFIQIFLVLGIILFLGIKMLAGTISIGSFAGLLNAAQELGSSIQQIFTFIPDMVQNSLYIDNINAFLDYQSIIEQKDTGILLGEDNHVFTLNLDNVCFRYTPESPFVLKNISFTINPRETIAIVGYNGSGKTTLIKNILRLYDPTSGSIFLDGHDYKEYNVYSLRNHIGIIFQDFQCFATTIADNILLRPTVTDEDEQIVWKALEMSGLDEKVHSFKNDIHTVLTKEFDEDGVVLSGGEMQKLALARLFAHNYDILILDEPSSALDPLAEYDLNKCIMEIAKEKTLIMISHRLSTTRDADRIIYMENGSIEEIGTHNELMSLNKKYAYLYNLQAEKYMQKTICE